jgi:hypothetical protein
MEQLPLYARKKKLDLVEINQTVDCKFSLAIKKDNHYQRTLPWLLCRDYLNDSLVHQVTKKRVSSYGFVIENSELLDMEYPILLVKHDTDATAEYIFSKSNELLRNIVGLDFDGFLDFAELRGRGRSKERAVGLVLSPRAIENTIVFSLVHLAPRAALGETGKYPHWWKESDIMLEFYKLKNIKEYTTYVLPDLLSGDITKHFPLTYDNERDFINEYEHNNLGFSSLLKFVKFRPGPEVSKDAYVILNRYLPFKNYILKIVDEELSNG